jgi:hypothetical protein
LGKVPDATLEVRARWDRCRSLVIFVQYDVTNFAQPLRRDLVPEQAVDDSLDLLGRGELYWLPFGCEFCFDVWVVENLPYRLTQEGKAFYIYTGRHHQHATKPAQVLTKCPTSAPMSQIFG